MGIYRFEDHEIYRYAIWRMDEDESKLRKILGNDYVVPFTNPTKRIEFLSVRTLAKLMDIDPLNIVYHPSGKPYLKNNKTNISISHTKDYTAILLSDEPYVGADIEHLSDRVVKVRGRYMHPEEEKNLSKANGDEVVSLLLHWSAKEALFKAIPDEGVDFINELRIVDFCTPSGKGSFKAKALRSGMNFQIDYCIEKDFVFTACFPLFETSIFKIN